MTVNSFTGGTTRQLEAAFSRAIIKVKGKDPDA